MAKGFLASHWLGLALLGGVAASIAGLGLNVYAWFPSQRFDARLNTQRTQLMTPSVYEAAGRQLAVLCQSDQRWMAEDSDPMPAWAPVALLELKPSWILIRPDYAKLEFGGGKYHLSYELYRDGSSPDQSDWILSLQSEDQPVQFVNKFTTPARDHVEQDPFVENAVQEYDRRIGTSQDVYRPRDARARAIFMQRHGLSDRLQGILLRDADRLEYDWVDQLLRYVWSTHDDSAVQRLENWASSSDSFVRWMYVAYAYEAADQPDRADHAIDLAMQRPVIDSVDVETIVPHCGMAMCLRLLDTGRASTAVRLCDALLKYDKFNPLQNELRQIRRRASFPLPFKLRNEFPNIIDDMIFKPFNGIDLHANPNSGRPVGVVG